VRRLSTYFALLLIWAGVLTPFVTAAQLSSVPACCRRNGMHHCQMYSGQTGSSGGTGFRAQPPRCPYSTPALLAVLTGLEPVRFNLSTPAAAGVVAPARLDRAYAAAVQHQSARGPPSLL